MLGDLSSTPTRKALCNLPNWPLEKGESLCSALGLPIALHIAGAPFAESTVLALARAYERETACTRGILRHSRQLCH